MSDPDRELDIEEDDEDQRDQDDGKKGRKFDAKDDEDALYRELGEKADIPDDFRDFLLKLKKALGMRDMDKLKHLYEHDLETLTDKYFKATVCPTPNAVMQLIASEDDDRRDISYKYFEILYKELYFRHVYKVGPTVDDRFDSFDNYIDLLDLILALKIEKPAIELPLQWLWDVLDEFIYQFRSFHQFRREFRQHNLSEQNIEQIKQHQHLWSAQTVIEYLHELAKKGGVDISKFWSRKGEEKVQQQGSYPEFFVALSQFALIGLSRVYCSIGDYTSSIKCLDPIDLTNKNKSPFNSVISAKVTFHYYLGFAYLMLRRYADAVKTFSYFLVYLNRKLGKYSRTVERKSQKMSGLLAIANSLSPQNLDDSLHASQDKLKNRGYEAIFQESAPKFINPAPPDYDAVDTSPGVGQLQKMIFLNEIKQRSNLQHTYGYLKMCTNVHISKLADFLHFESEKEQEKEREKEEQRQKEEERSRARQAGILDGEGKEDHKEKDTKEKEKEKKKEKKEKDTTPKHKDEDTATVLLKLKHKTRNLRWASGGPSSSGRWVSSSEVDFYLEKDVVVISEHRPVRPYGDFFIKNTIKYQELVDDLQQK